MKIGPKYKIARRLGAPIFEKTQTQKFALSQTKKAGGRGRKRMSKRTDYGIQLIEKQKARYTYLLSEKQFSGYIKKVLDQKGATNKADLLFEVLERRIDNTVFRMGLAPTRLASRQMVSHGHITVNGRRVTIPSLQVKTGDKIAIKKGSQGKGLFANLDQRLKDLNQPNWIKFDIQKKEAEIAGKPELVKAETLSDLKSVLEFYSR